MKLWVSFAWEHRIALALGAGVLTAALIFPLLNRQDGDKTGDELESPPGAWFQPPSPVPDPPKAKSPSSLEFLLQQGEDSKSGSGEGPPEGPATPPQDGEDPSPPAPPKLRIPGQEEKLKSSGKFLGFFEKSKASPSSESLTADRSGAAGPSALSPQGVRGSAPSQASRPGAAGVALTKRASAQQASGGTGSSARHTPGRKVDISRTHAVPSSIQSDPGVLGGSGLNSPSTIQTREDGTQTPASGSVGGIRENRPAGGSSKGSPGPSEGPSPAAVTQAGTDEEPEDARVNLAKGPRPCDAGAPDKVVQLETECIVTCPDGSQVQVPKGSSVLCPDSPSEQTPATNPCNDGVGSGCCRDNPEPPPAGYKWKALCSQSCRRNVECPRGTNNQEGWCYPFEERSNQHNWNWSWRCLKLERLPPKKPRPGPTPI